MALKLALYLWPMCLVVGCAAPAPSRAPALDPPPAAKRRLDREDVVRAAQKRAPGAAIAYLDRYPFDFELSAELAWLKSQDLALEVIDYLEKRARVDWESLRGDIDPDQGRETEEDTR